MPDFAVNTAFGGKDRGINAAWKRMTKNARLFGNTSANAFDKASRSGRRFQGITKSILAAGLVQRGIGLLTRGISEVVSGFIDMDQAVTGATVRFKDIGPKAANFAEKMGEIEKAVRKAASETEFTGKQAGEAMDFLARAGFNSTDAMKALVPMINLATASGEDFAQVADQSSDLLGAFGLASKDSAQKLKNLIRLNDVLTKSANSANVTIQSQFETMKVAAPIFSILGDQLEEVAALTAIMGNAGIKGGQGATALKNALLRLAAPTPKVAAGMELLGLKFKDVATIAKDGKVNMKPMTEILSAMAPLLKKLGTKDQAEVLDAIFGKRAIASVANLTKLIDEVKDFKTMLKSAGGTTKDTAEIMRKTLKNRIARLISVSSEAGNKILSAFKGDAKEGITSFADAVEKFDVKPIIESMKTLISVIKFIAPAILPVIKGFIAWKVAMVAWKTAMIAGKVATFAIIVAIKAKAAAQFLLTGANWKNIASMIVQKTAMIAGKVATFAFIVAIKAMAVAQWLLNAAMTANPIGLIIAGVAALAAGFIFLSSKAGGVANAFIVIGKVIMKAILFPINLVLSGIQKLLSLLSKIPGFGKKLEPALAAVKNFQTGLNKPFEITEFEDERNRKAFESAKQNRSAQAAFGIKAPNAAEIKSSVDVNLSGTIGVQGPPGTTVKKDKRSATGIVFELLGAN